MDERTTCVIVDDHEVVRAGTRAGLEAAPWITVVGEAANVAEALRVLREQRPRLALVDMRLPGGDGLGVLREAIQEGLVTRVVLYSGTAPAHVVEQALEAGAAGFVLKGSPFGVVLDALESARDGRRYVDPTIAAELVAGSGGTRLSPREREILPLIANGGQNATIAFELGISTETVKAHISSILVKLEAASRTEAVTKAMREGLID